MVLFWFLQGLSRIMAQEVGIHFKEAEEFFSTVALSLQKKEAMKQSLDTIEEGLRSDVRELGRKLLQGHIDSRGNGDIGLEVVTNDNVTLTHKRILPRKLNTVFGTVVINRVGYSSKGRYSLFPLETP
jgi:hypothetical protein